MLLRHHRGGGPLEGLAVVQQRHDLSLEVLRLSDQVCISGRHAPTTVQSRLLGRKCHTLAVEGKEESWGLLNSSSGEPLNTRQDLCPAAE
jgi:hypothetical protein